jgi:hypothetical protein
VASGATLLALVANSRRGRRLVFNPLEMRGRGLVLLTFGASLLGCGPEFMGGAPDAGVGDFGAADFAVPDGAAADLQSPDMAPVVGINWPPDQVFPSFAPVGPLDVVIMPGHAADVLTLAVTLEGIVNRTRW